MGSAPLTPATVDLIAVPTTAVLDRLAHLCVVDTTPVLAPALGLTVCLCRLGVARQERVEPRQQGMFVMIPQRDLHLIPVHLEADISTAGGLWEGV